MILFTIHAKTNMKYFPAILLLFICLTKLNAQTPSDCNCHDKLYNLSDYYESKGNIEKAIEIFKNSLKFKPKAKWQSNDYYRLGDLYAVLGDFKQSSKHFKNALTMGHDEAYLTYQKFDKLKESPYWIKVQSELDRAKRKYQKNINLDYRLAVEDIRGSDQTIRRLIKVPDSTFYELDSINYNRIKELVDKYGFPEVEKHGFDGYFGVYLVYIHASRYTEEMYQEILDVLNSANENFAFRKSIIAQFIDSRETFHHKRPQIYGRANYYKAKEFREIADIETIDSRRFNYNLLRLKEQAVIEKRTLPEGYIETEYPENYFCGYKLEK